MKRHILPTVVVLPLVLGLGTGCLLEPEYCVDRGPVEVELSEVIPFGDGRTLEEYLEPVRGPHRLELSRHEELGTGEEVWKVSVKIEPAGPAIVHLDDYEPNCYAAELTMRVTVTAVATLGDGEDPVRIEQRDQLNLTLYKQGWNLTLDFRRWPSIPADGLLRMEIDVGFDFYDQEPSVYACAFLEDDSTCTGFDEASIE